MDKRKENIIAGIMFIGLVSHYLFGYFFWDELTAVNIYYITVYWCMDLWGFTVYLLACGRILKGVGALGMLLGSYFFYMEFNDPSVWAERDYLTLGLVFSNCFFIWYFTDKIKTKNK
jgi:hypothetical protein